MTNYEVIFDAVCNGDIETFNELKDSIDLSQKDNELLNFAAANGHLEIIESLLQYVSVVKGDTVTALKWAHKSEHDKVVDKLLEYV